VSDWGNIPIIPIYESWMMLDAIQRFLSAVEVEVVVASGNDLLKRSSSPKVHFMMR